MKFFGESIDRKIWNAITSGSHISMFEKNSKGCSQLDCIAKNIIVFALNSNKLVRISKYVLAKDMCDTLERTHKDSSGAVWLDNDLSSSESSCDVSKTNIV